MTLKPWREIAIPHEDVLKGTFQQAEFAADLSRVHDGTAALEYQDPVRFFDRTVITEGMRLLLDSVILRLTGRGGEPVIQLQTAFGGGKTHTLLAVYHLARGDKPASELAGVSALLDAGRVATLPKARIAVLDGNKQAPNIPQEHGDLRTHTLWGELAWQLGGEAGYALVRDADLSGTSPGKEILARLLAANAPAVVLMDELVAYVRQFEEGKSLTGGTYDSNLSFLQALTEAVKAVPNAVLLASLPESDREAGSQRGVLALRSLEHHFARLQALWKPVATDEAFEIVRRRLFASVRDVGAAEAVCRAFAAFYRDNAADLPAETQEGGYLERMQHAYPFHPEVFVRLYEDWSTLEHFQRTRGVLKWMAKAVHRLWKDGNNDLLILPGSLPLYDADNRNEALYYLPAGWDPVLERDVDGERAETTQIESRDTRLGSVQACRRTARAIFLGSAPSVPDQRVRGIEAKRVILGVAQPGQTVGVFEDALKRLEDRLHYLNHAGGRYWFDTRPNLRREMEERKRRLQDPDDLHPPLREALQKSLGGGAFGGVHVFTPSADVPDDGTLRLVVLPPEAPYHKKEPRQAVDRAGEILKRRGEAPRQRQNRLLFLAADAEAVAHLKDHVRSLLAWKSIVADYDHTRIVLDNLMIHQAKSAAKQAQDDLLPMLRETYKWVLSPMQEAVAGKGISEIRWEAWPLDRGAASIGGEIARILKENALVIGGDWAPVHLKAMLEAWFWKDGPAVSALEVWQKCGCYLYLQRLEDEATFWKTIEAGAPSRAFFGLAYGQEEGRFLDLSFGQGRYSIPREGLLLVDPRAAEAQKAAEEQAAEEARRQWATTAGEPGTIAPKPLAASEVRDGDRQPKPAATPPAPKRRFYGTLELDPVKARNQFGQLIDEVLIHLIANPAIRVKLTVDLEAEAGGAAGFGEALERTLKENANALRFKAELE